MGKQLLYSPEPRHGSLPPVPSAGGSGVSGDRETEDPKYLTQSWLVMALAAPRRQPRAQVPAWEIPGF